MFIYSEQQIDDVQSGDVDDELVIIGLEVKEGEGVVSTAQFDDSTHFPQPRTTLSEGTKYVVMMPDSGLSRLYGDARMNVHHDPAEVAKCFLAPNYLAPEVFGREADFEIRAEVFDYLDIEDGGISADTSQYREKLREVAGMEDPEVEEEVVTTRAEELKNEYKYTELKSKASDMGIDNANQKKDVLAEWIADNEE